MRLLLPLALLSITATSHALLVDGFSDGALDTGFITPGATSYAMYTTPATAMSGKRIVEIQTFANPFEEAYRVRTLPGNAMTMVSNGFGLDGLVALSYTTPTMNVDLSANPFIQVDFVANDLPNNVNVEIADTSGNVVVRSVLVPSTASPSSYSFNFAGEGALSNVRRLSIFFDYAPSGDFAISSVNAVPEPISLAAMATGVALFGLRRRKR